MRPNSTCSFEIPNFDVLKGCGYVRIPRNDLLQVAVNPYTGVCVMSFQRDENSLAMLDYLMEQYEHFKDAFERLNRRPATFADFAAWCREVA